jgi:hypothetical protein
MNPVFAIDGTKLFNSESVERKIEELEDEIRVTRGNANIAYSLNSFYERDIKKQKRKRCLAMVEMLEHICPITIRKAKWKGKWHMRWLELAEKFK